MATRIKNFKTQAESQSCTALAIKCTLHEFGKSTYSGVAGGELLLWEELKRGKKKGEEEILPHAAIKYLSARGCTVELIENKVRTRPLAHLAAQDYADYLTGLRNINVIPVDRAIDLDADFADDMRVFMIVGFPDAKLGKLATHTVLCRKDGGNYWALNPDGATDKAYTRTQLETFLQHTDPTIAPSPEFGSKTIYTYTGICYRVAA